MRLPKEIVCLIPTWCTARHAVGAANSLRKYYPTIPVYFVDDKFTPDQEAEWANVYSKGADSYDSDPQKLINYPNSCYILREHIENETNGHGLAITHAMQFIHAKWVVHISTDTRIFRADTLEYLFEGLTNNFCGSGNDWTREGTPALASWLFVFRGDLYHKYDLDFKADRDKLCDIGTNYYSKLLKKGYEMDRSKNLVGNYVIHLGSTRHGNEETWDKYF